MKAREITKKTNVLRTRLKKQLAKIAIENAKLVDILMELNMVQSKCKHSLTNQKSIICGWFNEATALYACYAEEMK